MIATATLCDACHSAPATYTVWLAPGRPDTVLTLCTHHYHHHEPAIAGRYPDAFIVAGAGLATIHGHALVGTS